MSGRTIRAPFAMSPQQVVEIWFSAWRSLVFGRGPEVWTSLLDLTMGGRAIPNRLQLVDRSSRVSPHADSGCRS